MDICRLAFAAFQYRLSPARILYLSVCLCCNQGITNEMESGISYYSCFIFLCHLSLPFFVWRDRLFRVVLVDNDKQQNEAKKKPASPIRSLFSIISFVSCCVHTVERYKTYPLSAVTFFFIFVGCLLLVYKSKKYFREGFIQQQKKTKKSQNPVLALSALRRYHPKNKSIVSKFDDNNKS